MTLIRTEMTQSNFQSNTWLLVIPFWTFLIINMNRDISQSNSKSRYVGSPSHHITLLDLLQNLKNINHWPTYNFKSRDASASKNSTSCFWTFFNEITCAVNIKLFQGSDFIYIWKKRLLNYSPQILFPLWDMALTILPSRTLIWEPEDSNPN